MKLTWLGHACFAVESGGYTVVLDPYTLENYPPLHAGAHRVLCSHTHRDHAFLPAVTLLPPPGEDPFAVETVESFHDDRGGALRGTNTIHILCAEGLRVAHLGDLGHELSEEQLDRLRGVDALLLPVGGYYTIDAPTAKRVADAVAPRVIVPMHYRHGDYGLREVGTAEEFLRLFPDGEVRRLDTNSFELTHDAPRGVIVPRFAG